MRLALVERTPDGEITYRLQPGDDNLFTNMGALEHAMREKPGSWTDGTEWTLVTERPILTVKRKETFTVETVDPERSE